MFHQTYDRAEGLGVRGEEMGRYSRRKLFEEVRIYDYDPEICKDLAEDEEFLWE